MMEEFDEDIFMENNLSVSAISSPPQTSETSSTSGLPTGLPSSDSKLSGELS